MGLATAIATLDVFFILVAVPESLPEKLRFNNSWSAAHITWENADPFSVSSKQQVLHAIPLTFFYQVPNAEVFFYQVFFSYQFFLSVIGSTQPTYIIIMYQI